MKTASVNAGQAGSMLQIADGAMATISDILVRMKELAVQATSGQFSSTERSILDSEFQALSSEITRISDDTEFNGTQLIAGAGDTVTQQIAFTDQLTDNGLSVTYDTNTTTDGDAYRISYDGSDNLTVTNVNSGDAVTVDITAALDAVIASRSPAGTAGNDLLAGESIDVAFTSLGITVTVSGGDTPGTDGFDRDVALGSTGAIVVATGSGISNGGAMVFTNSTSSVTNAALTALLASTNFSATTGLLTLTMNNTGTDVVTFQADNIDLGGGIDSASADVDLKKLQVQTITVTGTIAAGDLFVVNINGTDYTTTGEADITAAALELSNNVNADGAVSTSVALGVITITSATDGTEFFTTVGTSEADLSASDSQTIVLVNDGTGNSVLNASGGTQDITLAAGGVTLGTVSLDALDADAGDDGTFTLDLGSMLFGQDTTTGGSNSSFSFKVGTGNETYDTLTFTVNASSASALGVLGTDQSGLIAITTAALAETASTAVSTAIDTLNTTRSDVGAAQNRLGFAAQNLASAIENAEAARSTLLDLDVAKEITTFTSKQVLLQTGIAMLAQANQMPQNLLRLFQ